jgi:hypothetical protein
LGRNQGALALNAILGKLVCMARLKSVGDIDRGDQNTGVSKSGGRAGRYFVSSVFLNTCRCESTGNRRARQVSIPRFSSIPWCLKVKT